MCAVIIWLLFLLLNFLAWHFFIWNSLNYYNLIFFVSCFVGVCITYLFRNNTASGVVFFSHRKLATKKVSIQPALCFCTCSHSQYLSFSKSIFYPYIVSNLFCFFIVFQMKFYLLSSFLACCSFHSCRCFIVANPPIDLLSSDTNCILLCFVFHLYLFSLVFHLFIYPWTIFESPHHSIPLFFPYFES